MYWFDSCYFLYKCEGTSLEEIILFLFRGLIWLVEMIAIWLLAFIILTLWLTIIVQSLLIFWSSCVFILFSSLWCVSCFEWVIDLAGFCLWMQTPLWYYVLHMLERFFSLKKVTCWFIGLKFERQVKWHLKEFERTLATLYDVHNKFWDDDIFLKI